MRKFRLIITVYAIEASIDKPLFKRVIDLSVNDLATIHFSALMDSLDFLFRSIPHCVDFNFVSYEISK